MSRAGETRRDEISVIVKKVLLKLWLSWPIHLRKIWTLENTFTGVFEGGSLLLAGILACEETSKSFGDTRQSFTWVEDVLGLAQRTLIR